MIDTYILKPYFKSLGEPFTNEKMCSQISGAIDTSDAMGFLLDNGSEIRYLEAQDEPLISNCASSIDSCVELNNLSLKDIGGIIYAGIDKEQLEPATAASVANELGAPRVRVLDVTIACSGMAHAIEVASGWLSTSVDIDNIAIVTTFRPRRFIDWNLNTAKDLMHLGAGLTLGSATSCIIVSRTKPSEGIKVKKFIHYDNSRVEDYCKLPIHGLFSSESHKLVKHTVAATLNGKSLLGSLPNNTWIFPHQASTKLHELHRYYKTDPDKTIMTHHLYGNTAESAWISAYDYALSMDDNRIQDSDPVIIQTLAGGFTSIIIYGFYVKS